MYQVPFTLTRVPPALFTRYRTVAPSFYQRVRSEADYWRTKPRDRLGPSRHSDVSDVLIIGVCGQRIDHLADSNPLRNLNSAYTVTAQSHTHTVRLLCFFNCHQRFYVKRLSNSMPLSIGVQCRTFSAERPRKTKIGTGIAHVTRDWDTTFKVKWSKVKVTRPLYSPRH